MSRVHEEEIGANLACTDEALTAARLLRDRDLHDSAASRAYYAAFHAATAAILQEGEPSKTHSSTLAAFHRVYVRTGRIGSEHGKALNQLFELRAIGDYGELQHVTGEEADYAVTVAEHFVTAVRSVLAAVP